VPVAAAARGRGASGSGGECARPGGAAAWSAGRAAGAVLVLGQVEPAKRSAAFRAVLHQQPTQPSDAPSCRSRPGLAAHAGRRVRSRALPVGQPVTRQRLHRRRWHGRGEIFYLPSSPSASASTSDSGVVTDH
jgi:hypothetical protein